MKFLLATAALALGAAAQSIGDLPQCSLPCFIQYVPSTGCALTDVACLCASPCCAAAAAALAALKMMANLCD